MVGVFLVGNNCIRSGMVFGVCNKATVAVATGVGFV